MRKRIKLFHSDKLKKTYENYGIPPLHAHEIFAIKKNENREFKKAAREAAIIGIKLRRKKNVSESMSSFLRDKLLLQFKEKHRKRVEMSQKGKNQNVLKTTKKEIPEGQDELEEVKNYN